MSYVFFSSAVNRPLKSISGRGGGSVRDGEARGLGVSIIRLYGCDEEPDELMGILYVDDDSPFSKAYRGSELIIKENVKTH